MSKLTKIMHKIFGINADFSYQMGKFGSFKNGSPQYAANVSDIQSLPNWETGLFDSVVANSAPLKEDINSALHHSSRQLGYLYQAGIPEWDTDTVYYTNSFVSYEGAVYKCTQDNCTGQTPTVPSSYWILACGADIVSHYEIPIAGQAFTSDSLSEKVEFSTKILDAFNLVSNPTTNWALTVPEDGYYEFSGYLFPLGAMASTDWVSLTLDGYSGNDSIIGEKVFVANLGKEVPFYKKVKLSKNDVLSIFLSYHRAAGNTNFIGSIIVKKV